MTIELHLLSFAVFALAMVVALWHAVFRRPQPAPHQCTRPCQSEAHLSALTAANDRLHDALHQLERLPHCAVHRAAEATRRKLEDPLPGTGRRTPEKPAKPRPPQAKGRRG